MITLFVIVCCRAKDCIGLSVSGVRSRLSAPLAVRLTQPATDVALELLLLVLLFVVGSGRRPTDSGEVRSDARMSHSSNVDVVKFAVSA